MRLPAVFAVALIQAVFLLSGCATLGRWFTERETDRYRSKIRQELEAVNVADGVDESEAKALAKNSLVDKDSRILLDHPTVESSDGPSWRVIFPVCISAIPIGRTTTLVDKSTGEVSWDEKVELEDRYKKNSAERSSWGLSPELQEEVVRLAREKAMGNNLPIEGCFPIVVRKDGSWFVEFRPTNPNQFGGGGRCWFKIKGDQIAFEKIERWE